MECPRHKFLACASLAEEKHCGGRAGHLLHLIQYLLDGGTMPDDLAEVALAFDLFLQVDVIRVKPILEASDLLIRGEGRFLRSLALCEVLGDAVVTPDPAVSSAYCPGAFANE